MATKKTPRSICPACKNIIKLERRHKRQELVECPQCGQILEVVREYPQQLDFPNDPYIPSSGRPQHRLH